MQYEFSSESEIIRCTPECGEEVFKLGQLAAYVRPLIIKYSDDEMTKRNIERVTFDIGHIIKQIIREE